MGSCHSFDLNPASNHVKWPRRLPIALIGPNETGRRAVASALKSSPNAEVFEFDSYPPERGYIRALVENSFSVVILELDSNVELALELIKEASECPAAAVLAYSIRSDSKFKFKALQAGALAYSLSADASELRQQLDKIAGAYASAEDESRAASQPDRSDLVDSDEHPHQVTSQLPAVLPDDFNGWDGSAASEGSRRNEAEAEHGHSLAPIEKVEDSEESGPSLLPTSSLEDEVLRSLKVISANRDQSFWPKTSNDTEETISFEHSSSATERLLKISTSKLWSGILFSGDRERTYKFDSAQVHDADQALEAMFRRNVKKSRNNNTPRRRGKIAASIGVAAVLILAIALIAWLHPHPLFTMGQTLLHGQATKVVRTSASTKPPQPQSLPANRMRSGVE